MVQASGNYGTIFCAQNLHINFCVNFVHRNLCCKHGKAHTGWSSYEHCTSVMCTKFTLQIQKAYEHHVCIDCTTDITCNATWQLEKRGLRECDRLRRQMETTEERKARLILIML